MQSKRYAKVLALVLSLFVGAASSALAGRGAGDAGVMSVGKSGVTTQGRGPGDAGVM